MILSNTSFNLQGSVNLISCDPPNKKKIKKEFDTKPH